MTTNPRYANGSRRRALKKRVGGEGNPCHLCGYPINYEAHYMSPHAFVLDEIVPVSKGGSPYDRSNVEPAHRCCNGWRSDKDLTIELRRSIRARYEKTFMKRESRTSRNWIA